MKIYNVNLLKRFVQSPSHLSGLLTGMIGNVFTRPFALHKIHQEKREQRSGLSQRSDVCHNPCAIRVVLRVLLVGRAIPAFSSTHVSNDWVGRGFYWHYKCDDERTLC